MSIETCQPRKFTLQIYSLLIVLSSCHLYGQDLEIQWKHFFEISDAVLTVTNGQLSYEGKNFRTKEYTQEKLSKDQMINIPKEVVSKRGKPPGYTINSDKVYLFKNQVYVKKGSVLAADGFVSVKLSGQPAIVLEPVKRKYRLVLQPDELLLEAGFIDENLKLKLQSGSSIIPTKMVYTNKNAPTYEFEVNDGLEFDLSLWEEQRFDLSVPFNHWRKDGNHYVYKASVGLAPFKLEVALNGPALRKVTGLRLVSEKNKGVGKEDKIRGSQKKYAQFIDLDWDESPFDISLLGDGVSLDTLHVDTSHAKQLNHLNILYKTFRVVSHIPRINVKIINSLGKPAKNKLATLKNAKEHDISNRTILDNGECFFLNINDWENCTIRIETLDNHLVDHFSIKEHITHNNKSYIDVVIQLKEQ